MTDPNGVSSDAPQDKPTGSPHDTLVYKTLSKPELAAPVLRSYMTDELAAAFDWDSLVVEPNRFVDPNLKNNLTDILYSVNVFGRKTHIHVLFEHSSGPKPYELLQAARYQVRIWEQEAEKQATEGLEKLLTPIMTVIFHHSKTGWRGRLRFREYFDLDEQLARLLAPYMIDFGVIVDDISAQDTEALLKRPVPPEVGFMLFVLRYGRGEPDHLLNELKKLQTLLGQMLRRPAGVVVLQACIVYMKKVAGVTEAQIRMALQDIEDRKLYEQFVEEIESFERMVALRDAQSKLEGKLEGERNLLLRLLGQRFGLLPALVTKRISSASGKALEAMSLRVLTASTLDEVLAVADETN